MHIDGRRCLMLIGMPVDENGLQHPSANTLGIRHIAIAVEDIEAVVANLKEKVQPILASFRTPPPSAHS